ncbi:MAG: Hpt domain-containing protein [bacterium]|nr:Hpt domain-containing protein [bacterium]
MAKYRRIFLEEATDHLAEISRALLELEKEMGNVEAIDTIFRMAHSIKSMAASLGYDPVSELSHRLEDRMEGVRTSGRVRDPEELSLLFRGLETLETMVQTVANDDPLAPADEGLLAELAEAGDALAAASPEAVGGEPKKVPS